jgi:hypothetical protein
MGTMALENPKMIQHIRRDVARLNTILRERELAETPGTADETPETTDEMPETTDEIPEMTNETPETTDETQTPETTDEDA